MRVVHVKLEPYTDYIGRGSVFGNPFTHMPLDKTKALVRVGSRDEAVHAFKFWAIGQAYRDIEPKRRKRMLKAIAALKSDAVLGCYCKYRQETSCHGDVIVYLYGLLTKQKVSNVVTMAINSESLIEKLALVDENILSEAAQQPILFVDAARYRVSTMRKRAQAVAELDSKRSRVALTIRARRTAGGDKKYTEAELKERVESQSSIRMLRADVDRAYELEEFGKLILEAYRMRRDAIRVIAESQIAEGMRGGHEVERIEQSRRLRKKAMDLEDKRRRLEED